MDALRRDVFEGTKEVSVQQKTQDAEQTPMVSRPAGHLKAEQFVLACLVFKKPFATSAKIENLTFKNSNYQKLFNFVHNLFEQGKTFTLSSLCDYFDVDENEDIKQIFAFDFSQFEQHEETYFFECLNKIEMDNLKSKQEELGRSFKEEKDPQKKREIALMLNKLAKEIKMGERKNV